MPCGAQSKSKHVVTFVLQTEIHEGRGYFRKCFSSRVSILCPIPYIHTRELCVQSYKDVVQGLVERPGRESVSGMQGERLSGP